MEILIKKIEVEAIGATMGDITAPVCSCHV